MGGGGGADIIKIEWPIFMLFLALQDDFEAGDSEQWDPKSSYLIRFCDLLVLR